MPIEEYLVFGTLEDSSNNPITGETVYAINTSENCNITTTTNSPDGDYQLDLSDLSTINDGDTIHISAAYNGESQSNSFTLDVATPFKRVDLTLSPTKMLSPIDLVTINRNKKKEYATDTLLERFEESPYDLDSNLIAKYFKNNLSFDVLTKLIEEKNVNLDALIETLNLDRNLIEDALIKKLQEMDIDIDSVLISRILNNYTIDAVTKRTNVPKSILIDAVIEGITRSSKDYDLDTVLEKINISRYDIDTRISGLANENNLNVDVVLGSIGRWRSSVRNWGMLVSYDNIQVDSTLSEGDLIKILIEVSDDENMEPIKDSKTVTLSGGEESIDVSDLSKSQYVRYKINLISASQKDTPRLHELDLNVSSHVVLSSNLKIDMLSIQKDIRTDYNLDILTETYISRQADISGNLQEENTKEMLSDILMETEDKELAYSVISLIEETNDLDLDIESLIKRLDLNRKELLDGLIQDLDIEKSYNIDILTETLDSIGIDISGLISELLQQDMTIDSLLESRKLRQELIDGLIEKRDKSREVNIEALISTLAYKHSDVDSLLEEININKLDVDSLTKTTDKEIKELLDALLEDDKVVNSYILAGVIVNREELDLSISGLLRDLGVSQELFVVAVIGKPTFRYYAFDGLLRELGVSKDIDVDSLIKGLDLTVEEIIDGLLVHEDIAESVDIDSLIETVKSLNHSIDSLIEILKDRELDIDGLLQEKNLRDIMIDSLVKKRKLSREMDIDVLISLLPQIRNMDIDSLIQSKVSKDIDVDSLTELSNQEISQLLDSLLQNKDITKSFLLAGILVNREILNVDVDTILKEIDISRNYIINAVVGAAKVKGMSIDILIKRLNLSKEHLVDALTKEIILNDMNIDSLLKKLDVSKDMIIDTIASGYNLRKEDISGLLKQIEYGHYNIDSLLKELEITKSEAIDVALGSAFFNIVSLDIDSLLQKGFSRYLIIDLLTSVTDSKSYAMDVYNVYRDKIYQDLDVCLQHSNILDYLIQASLLTTDSRDIIMDTNTKEVNLVNQLIRARVGLYGTISQKVDSNLLSENLPRSLDIDVKTTLGNYIDCQEADISSLLDSSVSIKNLIDSKIDFVSDISTEIGIQSNC